MGNGARELKAWVKRLRSLGTITDKAASDVAKEIERAVIEAAQRELAPDGRAWPKTADGRQALRNLRREISVRVIGGAIVLRLEGRYARHHLGAVRGKARRSMLPTGQIPDAMTNAIRTVVEREFARLTKTGIK